MSVRLDRVPDFHWLQFQTDSKSRTYEEECFRAIFRFTGVPDNELADVAYVNCLSMCLQGLRSLQTYNTNNKKWGQAHARARFVILNMLQQKTPEFITVKQFVSEKDGVSDLELTIDRFVIS